MNEDHGLDDIYRLGSCAETERQIRTQGGRTGRRRAHTPETAGSTPAPATTDGEKGAANPSRGGADRDCAPGRADTSGPSPRDLTPPGAPGQSPAEPGVLPSASVRRALPPSPWRTSMNEQMERIVLDIAGAAITGYIERLADGMEAHEAAVRTLQEIKARFGKRRLYVWDFEAEEPPHDDAPQGHEMVCSFDDDSVPGGAPKAETP